MDAPTNNIEFQYLINKTQHLFNGGWKFHSITDDVLRMYYLIHFIKRDGYFPKDLDGDYSNLVEEYIPINKPKMLTWSITSESIIGMNIRYFQQFRDWLVFHE